MIIQKKKNVRSTNEVDQNVGQRLRTRRIEIGLSQKQLAAKIGVSFQQLQKYENGFNRISASRLFLVAQVMEVPIVYFFSDVQGAEKVIGKSPYSLAEKRSIYTPQKTPRASQRENLELSRCYFSIQEKTTRQRLLAIMRSLASNES